MHYLRFFHLFRYDYKYILNGCRAVYACTGCTGDCLVSGDFMHGSCMHFVGLFYCILKYNTVIILLLYYCYCYKKLKCIIIISYMQSVHIYVAI